MTKLQLLHRALNERLMAAVEQIMEMVGGTVLEYEAETIRARKENETLRRRLRWMEGEIPTDWPDEVDPCVPEQPVSLAEEPVFEGLAIKTEPVDAFDCPLLRPDASLPASVCTTDLETVNPATSEPANVGLPNGTTWDSSQNYMAPLDFEPTMAGNWRGKGRSQRMSFACPDCGKVFGREQRLIFHMRIHSAERPYTYRRRKACFYGDKKRRKKLHGLSKLYLSKEIVEDLSDTSEQTERSTGSANVSAPRTAAPSAPEAETDKDLDKASKVTGNSKYPENTTAKPVGHKSRQGPGKSKILRCLECKKAFKSVSRLAVHMKTHRKSFPRGQEDTEKTDKRPRQHPKKPTMRNNEMEVERARAGGHSLFQCLECKKIFARSCWLTFHLKSHDRERALTHKEQKRFPSKKMQKNITQISAEVTEETKVAENSRAVRKVFPCPFCDKVFTREGWLGPHIRNHAVKMPPKRDILLQNILTGSRKKSQRTISQLLIEVTDDRKKMNRELKRKSETASDPPPTKIVASHKMTLESNKTRESKTSSNDSEGILEESKKITEETERIPEESAEAQSIPKSKKTFPCRECGKVYLLPGCLKTHKKIHKRERVQKLAQKKMKEEEEQSLVEGMMGNIVEKKRRKKKKLLEIQPSLNNVGQTKTLDTAVMLPEETADKSSHKKAPENKKKESTNTTKGRFVCKHCGKVYTRKNWLNMHMLGHGKAVEKTENIEEQKSDDGQAAQDSSSAEESTVQKEQDGGKVSYPCPFCDKVFGRGMRLMVHMQVHSSEKPYSYRQRKEQYYGDLTRPRVPDTYSQEPAVESSDEREKDGGFALTRNQTSTMSQDHTSTTEPKETVQPHSVCTGRKFSLLPLPSADAASSHSMDRSRTDSESVSTATSHFSLQPRIVLEPISAKFEHCAAPGKGDFQLVSAETSDKEPYKVSDASTSRTVDYPGNCYPSSQKAYDSQSVLSGMRSSVIPETDDPGTVCVNLGSDCKSFEYTSNPEKTLTLTVKPQYSGPPMGTISWSGKSRSVDTVSLSESEKCSNDRALLMKCAGIQLTRISESVLSGSSSVAMQQVAYPKSAYVNLTDLNSDNDDVDDDDDGDDSSNVSNNLDEKKTLTEGKMQAIKFGVKDAMSKQPARIHTKVEPVSSFLCWDSALNQTASEILTETEAVDSSFPRSLQKVADATSDIQFIPDETEEQSAERHEMVLTSVKQTKENSKGQCRSSTCMICGLIFVGRRALSQHMQVHSTSACISKTPSTLKTFKNMVKNNETKAKQDGDIQPMKADADLLDQEASVLQSTKEHTCQHCSASFCSPYHLRRHVYIHTGERPYWCSQCNLGFIQKYRFRNHRVAHHGDTVAKFNQDLAKNHQPPDRGEKTAQSELCEQSFAGRTPVSLEPSIRTAENPPSKAKKRQRKPKDVPLGILN